MRPKDRRPRPKRRAAAVDQLRTLQAEYEARRDQMPESLGLFAGGGEITAYLSHGGTL